MADPILLDAGFVRSQIERLKVTFPELESDADLLAGMIDGETDFHKIVERITDGILDADTTSDAIDLRVKNLRERQARFDRRSKAYRSVVIGLMVAAHTRKVQLTEATLGISKYTRVVVDDIDALPQGTFYMKRVAAPDTALRAMIEADGSIPGAHIEHLPDSLTIRTK